MSELSVHICQSPGLTTDSASVKEVINPNSRTGRYFVATEEIKTIFGQEVEASPLEAIGTTREIALERLCEKRKEFCDSLWA